MSKSKTEEVVGIPLSDAETNQTHDGETDPAIIIKMNNQRRVYEQHGLPWPPREPGEGPVAGSIVNLHPASAEVGGEDITLVVTGTGFTSDSKIIFNGGEETTNVMSENQCSTGVKPSLVSFAVTVPVLVRSSAGDSNELIFSFVEPAGRKGKKETSHEKDDQKGGKQTADKDQHGKAEDKAGKGWRY